MSSVVKIEPYEYIHVKDGNENVERVEIGPQTLVLQDHETITTGKRAKHMISLKPWTFCEIKNPVMRDDEGTLMFD